MRLEFNFEKVVPLPNIFQGASFEKLKRSLFTILLRQKDILFQQSKDPDGNAWKPLSKKAAMRKTAKNTRSDEEIAKMGSTYKAHKILVDTGVLKNSLTNPQAPYQAGATAGNEVSLGTNLKYAAIQNFGGTIESGKGYKIVIPARPFIGFGFSDESQVNEKISAYVDKQGKP